MPLNEKDLGRIEHLARGLVNNILAEYPEKNTPAAFQQYSESLANAMKQAIEAEVEAFRQELAG